MNEFKGIFSRSSLIDLPYYDCVFFSLICDRKLRSCCEATTSNEFVSLSSNKIFNLHNVAPERGTRI